MATLDFKDQEPIVLSAEAQARQRSIVKIRNAVSCVYDIQKLRIAAGNRLVQSFYIANGIKPGESPKELLDGEDAPIVATKKKGKAKKAEDAEAEEKRLADEQEKAQKKALGIIHEEYKKITDAIVENQVDERKLAKFIRENSSENKFTYIKCKEDFDLVDAYEGLSDSEKKLTAVVGKYVQEHPLWDKFFADIKGCGVLMSAVCLSYLDPYKARHVSSFFRYCGLDTVQDTDKEGNRLFLAVGLNNAKVREKFYFVYDDGSIYTGDVHKSVLDGEPIYRSKTGELLEKEFKTTVYDGEEVQVYEVVDEKSPYFGKEYVGEVLISEHGRRKGDTEMFEYISKEGEKKMKVGITYNPTVKTKLMGVLTGRLMMARDPVYTEIYYGYKKRLQETPKYKDYTAGHINKMAERYMIKQFLRNLWTCWRELEGLPVDNPYEVEKLGHAPHKYNQYQVDAARRSMGLASEE